MTNKGKWIKVNETYINLNNVTELSFSSRYDNFYLFIRFQKDYYKEFTLCKNPHGADKTGNVIEFQKLIFDFISNNKESFLNLDDFILANSER